MKPEHKKVMLKAMPVIIDKLEVDVSFLSIFESKNVLDTHSTEDILKEPTSAERAHRFCTFLFRSNDDAFSVLISALKMVGQDPIADELLEIERAIDYHSMPGHTSFADPENQSVQTAFFKVVQKKWPDIREHFRVNHYFLSFFICNDILAIKDVDIIMKGSLDGRVAKWFTILRNNSCVRPSVLFMALKNTSQEEIAEEMQCCWEVTSPPLRQSYRRKSRDCSKASGATLGKNQIFMDQQTLVAFYFAT